VEQVGQGDVDQGPDRLPGPLREEASGDQAAHRFVERVVVPLLLGAAVLAASQAAAQGIQHLADDAGAFGGQVAVDDPGALEGGLDFHRPVIEPVVRVAVGLVRAKPGQDLRRQHG
jgi:hypothetical protein